jgi:hypothetical protein
MKKFDFLYSTNFKALRYIKENSTSVVLLKSEFSVWPLLLLALCIKQPSYATVYTVTVCLRLLLTG